MVIDWKSDVEPMAQEHAGYVSQLSAYLSARGAERGAIVYMEPGRNRVGGILAGQLISKHTFVHESPTLLPEGAMKMRRVSGPFSFGTEPTIADAFLVPQVLFARRFGVDVSSYRQISAVYSHCMELAAFERAASEYVVKDAECGI